MSVVVTDATPIHYLILIGEIGLLQQLYGAVVVPMGVIHELSVSRAPKAVRGWVLSMPSWVEAAVVSGSETMPFPQLGTGEREAIWLAKRHAESLLLTDDLPAREAASSVGIQTVPTIRILTTAHALSLVDLDDALQRLKRTNFRLSRKVLESISDTQRLK